MRVRGLLAAAFAAAIAAGDAAAALASGDRPSLGLRGGMALEETRSFTVEGDEFRKDGQPFRILSGSIHYFRIVPEYWRDRLERLKAMGLNTITVYVAWNWHELAKDEFDFESPARNLRGFLEMAADMDLYVILRPGPYICAEWDFGGLPPYILEDGPIKLRTMAEPYISHVTRFFSKLFPIVEPLLYVRHGGPILLVQVENEYGSFGNAKDNTDDKAYLKYLTRLNREHFGPETLLFTTDNEWGVEHGSLPGDSLLTLVDGCENAAKSKTKQDRFNPSGKSPFICTETYTGWLTHWGEGKLEGKRTEDVIRVSKQILDVNGGKGNVNLYMAHGGTNFGFWAGANWDKNAKDNKYQPDLTSYDYNAPISEGGEQGTGKDGKNKYTAYQDLFRSYGAKTYDPPALPPRGNWGDIELDQVFPLLPNMDRLTSVSVRGLEAPVHAESFKCYSGFVSYQTTVRLPNGDSELWVDDFHDRLHVFVGSKSLGLQYRNENRRAFKIPASTASSDDAIELTLFVEHMGRINFDPEGMRDTRVGVLSGSPRLNGAALNAEWTARCHDFADVDFDALTWEDRDKSNAGVLPALFRGQFHALAPADTYLWTDPFAKGVAFVNGHNLGRYWTKPQHTLYVPGPWTRAGVNSVVLFELAGAGKSIRSQKTAHFD